MIVPFLIMLREGIEAALIVGIVASYLVRTGRREWLPALWVGVGLACAASLAAGAALDIIVGELPQRGQELFEAVIGLVAAAMLTSMVFWMRKAARSIKGELQAGVDAALTGEHQGLALVGLAFLAVVREGLESVFFLLAIFQQNGGWGPALGAGLGLLLAAGAGYAIYALGVKLNLRAFFRWTGILILFVAAGLVANAVRSLHEAGLWNHLQQNVYDLGTTLPADSAPGAILSGFFGYQERAALGEVIAYFAFLIPTLFLFLKGGRQEQAATAGPRPETRRSPRLKLAGAGTALLVFIGIGAFIYAAGPGSRKSALAGATDIAIAITDRSCEPATLTIPAGKASFLVTNRGERVLEWEILDGVMVLEERENIAPGQSRRLTTQLHPGEYAITCGLLSAPRGRLIVQASATQPRPALTLMDMVGPAAEYRAFLSERMTALGTAIDALEQARGAGDAQAADKARHDATVLLPALRPAIAGDAELEALFGKMQVALTDDAPAAGTEIKLAAETFRAALAQRTVLPDGMLSGAIALLSSPDGEPVSPEDIAAASGIARLLLPLTARVDPDLAARTRAVLVTLPNDAKPGGALRVLAEDLSAMRKALALPEVERRS
ncbi:High-affinity iron transporter [Hyphomicrobiales bacterium]|nr:High-affinity iron transporter [Hyphomicrobiales bacterium]CAH1697663.1 High-affinity iron transporter [Hyphomicrobiales bacterium]CAI0347310.1 high-affinity iron transporter [Hyphomicrobiales bacterium]